LRKFAVPRVCFILALVTACAGSPTNPQLDRATPASAAHGTTVALSGARLCGTSNDCMHVSATIQIGLELPAIDAPITDYTATAATIIIPDLAPPGPTELVVTVDNSSSNALAFEVLP